MGATSELGNSARHQELSHSDRWVLAGCDRADSAPSGGGLSGV